MATASKTRPKAPTRPRKTRAEKATADKGCWPEPKVKVCLVADLTERQIAACKRLTMPRGEMRSTLEGILHCKSPDVQNLAMKRRLEHDSVVMVTVARKLVAWALVRCSNPDIHANAHFFVDESQRRRGLGTLLVNEVVSRWPAVEFTGWDKSSVQFFLNLDIPLKVKAKISHGESPAACRWDYWH